MPLCAGASAHCAAERASPASAAAPDHSAGPDKTRSTPGHFRPSAGRCSLTRPPYLGGLPGADWDLNGDLAELPPPWRSPAPCRGGGCHYEGPKRQLLIQRRQRRHPLTGRPAGQGASSRTPADETQLTLRQAPVRADVPRIVATPGLRLVVLPRGPLWRHARSFRYRGTSPFSAGALETPAGVCLLDAPPRARTVMGAVASTSSRDAGAQALQWLRRLARTEHRPAAPLTPPTRF